MSHRSLSAVFPTSRIAIEALALHLMDLVGCQNHGLDDEILHTNDGGRAMFHLLCLYVIIGLIAGVLSKSVMHVHMTTFWTIVVGIIGFLILPPIVMLAVSRFKPVYDERYVLFCQPALALLCAAGLAWLARVVSMALPSARGRVRATAAV